MIAGRNYFGAGLTTTSSIYYGRYCNPNEGVCSLGTLNSALAQMHGDPNALTDPCNSANLRAPNR